MKYLHKIKRTQKINDQFFVFDVETQGLSARPESFIFGCIYGKDYKEVFYSKEEFLNILTHKRFKNKTIFAHNAEFDLTVMFDNILKNLDNKAIFNGRFIMAKNNGITFANSVNIFPFSVKEIGKQIGLDKLDLDEGFKDGTKTTVTHKDVEYCIRDCEIVYKALLEIFTICGSTKPTLAGLALTLFRNTYLTASIKCEETCLYDFFNSYYGGRVEAFRLGEITAYKYDINSMYPFAMLNAVFPNPARLRRSTNTGLDNFKYVLRRFEGMAEITVRHKDAHIGLLPIRFNKKLIFPTGKFKGHWNFNEIRFAIESGYVEILKVHEYVYSDRWKTPFKAFVEDIYNKRKNSEGIYKSIYKLILNSLYGKFAQKIKFEEEYHEKIPYELLCEYHEKFGQELEVVLFNKKREDCFIRTPKEKNLNHTIPLFSSYITSFARVELLRYMLKHENVLAYVDTDSVCLTEKIAGYNSLELGELKEEKDIIRKIYGNKAYDQETDGTVKLKMKGIPGKALKSGENKFTYKKMTKTREAIRQNKEVGHFKDIEKVVNLSYDKRIVNSDGTTKPLKLK